MTTTMRLVVFAVPAAIVVGLLLSLILGIPVGAVVSTVLPTGMDKSDTISEARAKSQPKVKADEKVQPAENARGGKRKNWAVVNDTTTLATVTMFAIEDEIVGAKVTLYPNCEAALASPVIHEVYLVDQNMGQGFKTGVACVPLIRAKAPIALVIPFTQNTDELTKSAFQQAGADLVQEVWAKVSIQEVIEVILKFKP